MVFAERLRYTRAAAGATELCDVVGFVDHLPYYRQEAINARSNVHTPRSTLAAWSGRGGAVLAPLFDVPWAMGRNNANCAFMRSRAR